MANDLLALLIFIVIILAMVVGLLWMLIFGKRNVNRSGSFASMAAFHDMQGKEKQNAIETIIEKQAEKKWDEEESGEEMKN